MERTYSHQILLNISEVCYRKGIFIAVISPGSRVAPLTLAFTRHPHFKVYTISDERSAAFVGLGIAQQKNRPVILCCTSGTAILNYAPAISEAFYQNIPLLVFTADRPPEWIHQQDGQTIMQTNTYQSYCRGSFSLPYEYIHPDANWHFFRIISEAINLCTSYPKGPVHINVPIREPFYPKENTFPTPGGVPKIINEISSKYSLPKKTIKYLQKVMQKYKKILIVCGQQEHIKLKLLKKFNQFPYPVISDIISNGHNFKESIRGHDSFLRNISYHKAKTLQPEVLISFGRSIVSKNMKVFLRRYPPKIHLYIQKAGQVADTFQTLTHIIRTSPIYFFKKIAKKTVLPRDINEYSTKWTTYDTKIKNLIPDFFRRQDFSELEAIYLILKALPKNWHLHLANSMTVRYANLINSLESSRTKVFSNRGTSGIDGSTSTFIGHSIVSSRIIHLLITGDLAFFYDRNAFWNQYIGSNIRIIILNNHGGIIFKHISVPENLLEIDDYFVTKQHYNAQLLCQEYKLTYFRASNRKMFETNLHQLFNLKKSALLEALINVKTSIRVFQNYQKEVKEIIEK